LTIRSRAVRRPRKSSAPTHVMVEFKDTGQGMAEEHCRRVFTSLLSTTKSQGTGLGLAIVAKVVESHRGKIKVASRLGHGTTFSIQLPCGN
jgi:signal transduction histidine kinase